MNAPLQTVEARYKDLLNRLGVLGHDGAIAEVEALRAENAKLRASEAKLREALGECAAIVDSFLNGQGAATTDEMDDALMSASAALAWKE